MRFSVFAKASEPSSIRPPDHECSRELADKIVSARWARRIGQNAIHLLIDQPWKWIKDAIRGDVQKPLRLYIPVNMPPREVPGVYFRPPESDQWKLAHRNVVLE
jgi:hypothetical protein